MLVVHSPAKGMCREMSSHTTKTLHFILISISKPLEMEWFNEKKSSYLTTEYVTDTPLQHVNHKYVHMYLRIQGGELMLQMFSNVMSSGPNTQPWSTRLTLHKSICSGAHPASASTKTDGGRPRCRGGVGLGVCGGCQGIERRGEERGEGWVVVRW